MLELDRYVVVLADVEEWIWIHHVGRLDSRATPDALGDQLHRHDGHHAGLPGDWLQVVSTHRLRGIAHLIVERFAGAAILCAADQSSNDRTTDHALTER